MDHTTEQELRDRLNLIESMIGEGRRTIEKSGWTFVLWGAAYYAALAWSAWNHSVWAWPVTISIAVIGTALMLSWKGGNHAETTLGRAIGAIWIALGISMFLLFLPLGLSGRLTDQHVFVAVISALLGMANGTSAMILRWKAQLACAVVWWAAAVASCFGSDAQSMVVFVVAIFLCQIAFGIYGVVAEMRGRHRPSHA